MYFHGPAQWLCKVPRLLNSNFYTIRPASAEHVKLFVIDGGGRDFIHNSSTAAWGITRQRLLRTSPAQGAGGAAVLRHQLPGGGLGGGLAGQHGELADRPGQRLTGGARRHRMAFAYRSYVRDVPWWGVVSSAAAPVLLVSGWTAAASLQPRFDPVAGTVSALAAQGATDRWVMTLTFLVVGGCYIVTALALRPAGATGRLILIAGAVAGLARVSPLF